MTSDSREAAEARVRSAQRDLNPHKPARAAMWLFGAEYARQGGGSMTFWDRLPLHRKNLCRELVSDIEKARPE